MFCWREAQETSISCRWGAPARGCFSRPCPLSREGFQWGRDPRHLLPPLPCIPPYTWTEPVQPDDSTTLGIKGRALWTSIMTVLFNQQTRNWVVTGKGDQPLTCCCVALSHSFPGRDEGADTPHPRSAGKESHGLWQRASFPGTQFPHLTLRITKAASGGHFEGHTK